MTANWCTRCGSSADEGGWCGVCGANLRPAETSRFSRTAQERERLWRADPTTAKIEYERRVPSIATEERAVSESSPAALEPATSKICPRCAEEVKAAARVCRFCSYDFAAAGEQANIPSKPMSEWAATANSDVSRRRLHPLVTGLVLTGCVALVVALLLPFAAVPNEFTGLEDNTVLKHGEWQYLIGAILGPILLFHIWRTGSTSNWILRQAVIMLGWSIFNLIDKDARTYVSLMDDSIQVVASPGAGLYLATSGALLVLGGGLLNAKPSLLEQKR
jgi:hypothetical protein